MKKFFPFMIFVFSFIFLLANENYFTFNNEQNVIKIYPVYEKGFVNVFFS